MVEPPYRAAAMLPLPMTDLLSLLRPTPAATTLLQACLLEGDRGRAALERWSRSAPAGDLLNARWNRLFPLLAESARRSDVALEPAVRSRLRAALASEEVRYQAYTKVFGPALRNLADDGVEVIVLKGAALAETAYPRPQLRHSHDVDLLIAADQRPNAVACLERCGWRRTGVARDTATQTFVHPSGLPLCLHTQLVRGALDPPELRTLRGRGKLVLVADVSVLTLSAADALFHILGQALSSGGFASLLWACDAFFCINCSEIDWDVFTVALRRSQLSPAYVELLRYLSEELEVALPATVIQRPVTPAPWTQREAMVASMHAGAFGLRNMWEGASGWPTRIALLKWFFLPGSDLARAIAPEIPRWQLPLRHLWRATTRLRSRSETD